MVPVLTLLALCHKVTRGGTDECMDKTLNQCIISFFLWVIFKTSFPLLFSSNQAARWKNDTTSSQLRDATHAMHGQYGSILIVTMDTSLLPHLEKLAHRHAWMKSSRNTFCTRVCMHNQSLCTLTHTSVWHMCWTKKTPYNQWTTLQLPLRPFQIQTQSLLQLFVTSTLYEIHINFYYSFAYIILHISRHFIAHLLKILDESP